MAQSAQSIARLVETPLYRGLKIDARPSKFLYSPGIVGPLAIIRVNLNTVPTSWAPWEETAPYRIESELIVPPGGTVAVRDVSAKIFELPSAGESPSRLIKPLWGVDYDESPVEQTLTINGQDSIELGTLITDPSTVEILAGQVMGETMGVVKPSVEIPGRIVLPERAYGWLRLRYPRRVAKAWITLPMFAQYLGFAHTGLPARSNDVIQREDGIKIYPRLIPWPNPFVLHKNLLAITAHGLRKAKPPRWKFKEGEVVAIVDVQLSADINALLGPGWEARPLIDPVTFDLVVSAPGRAAQTIKGVAMLPEPEVGWGEIWMLLMNAGTGAGTGDGAGVGMPEKITEQSREEEDMELRLFSDVNGSPTPFKVRFRRAKKIVFGYKNGEETRTLGMELRNE